MYPNTPSPTTITHRSRRCHAGRILNGVINSVTTNTPINDVTKNTSNVSASSSVNPTSAVNIHASTYCTNR